MEYFTWDWMEGRCGRLRTYKGYVSAPPSLGYDVGWNAFALELFQELEAVAIPATPGSRRRPWR